MSNHDQQITALTAKIQDGSATPDDFKQLEIEYNARKKAAADRIAGIAATKLNISTLGITIHEIYGKEELVTAVKSFGLHVGAAIPRAKAESPPPKEARKKKEGDVLISISASGKGRPAEWRKGQARPPLLPQAFANLRGEANIEAAIAKHFEDAGTLYFATDSGKKELAEVIDFVKSGKVKSKS